MGSAYSPEQIREYLSYISLPSKFHPSSKPALDIEFLTALHVHQIGAIPYENLILHYSPTRQISLDPQDLFKKLTKNGRGGYCMENSIFFNHILRALGFNAYTAGVNIRLRDGPVPVGDYVGWRHLVNIVTLPNGEKYAVDVGFGGDGPKVPLPMIHEQVVQNIGPQQIRLSYSTIPELVDQTQKRWVYQYRNGETLPWNSFYAFPGIEFTLADFEIMNYFTSTHATSFQRTLMMITKFLRKDDEIYGKVMLVDHVVKQNLGGKTVIVKECKTEAERIEALKEYFGITLSEEEKKAIKGYCTEII